MSVSRLANKSGCRPTQCGADGPQPALCANQTSVVGEIKHSTAVRPMLTEVKT